MKSRVQSIAQMSQANEKAWEELEAKFLAQNTFLTTEGWNVDELTAFVNGYRVFRSASKQFVRDKLRVVRAQMTASSEVHEGLSTTIYPGTNQTYLEVLNRFLLSFNEVGANDNLEVVPVHAAVAVRNAQRQQEVVQDQLRVRAQEQAPQAETVQRTMVDLFNDTKTKPLDATTIASYRIFVQMLQQLKEGYDAQNPYARQLMPQWVEQIMRHNPNMVGYLRAHEEPLYNSLNNYASVMNIPVDLPPITKEQISAVYQGDVRPIPTTTTTIPVQAQEDMDMATASVASTGTSRYAEDLSTSSLAPMEVAGPMGGVDLASDFLHPGACRHNVFKQIRDVLIDAGVYHPSNRWRGCDE